LKYASGPLNHAFVPPLSILPCILFPYLVPFADR
jgi:hypothetical protein